MQFIIIIFVLLLSACTSTTENNNQSYVDVTARKQKVAAYNVRMSMEYLQQGDVTRAQLKIMKALKLAPNWGPALSGMALFLAGTDEPADAEKYYKKALIAAPNSGDIHNNYGIFLCQQKQYQQGVAQFLTAIDKPGYANQAAAYENAGLCALKVVELQQDAINYFRKAVIKGPRRTTALFELSRLYYQTGEYDKASYYLKHYQMYIDKPAVAAKQLSAQIASKIKQGISS